MDSFSSLRAELQEGLALSKQGSYERRLPSEAGLVKVRNAQMGLRVLADKQSSAEVWRTLALAEEAMLEYSAAIAALEMAIGLSRQRSRKDLKRLELLKECAAMWKAVGLEPVMLAALGNYLERMLAEAPCDHTHRHTEAWLIAQKELAVATVIKGLESEGGWCDCEVLWNVV